MSADDLDTIQISVSPEPSDEELLAIMQALELLREDLEVSRAASSAESGWAEISRIESMRKRNWTYQVRSWTFKRD